MPNRPGPVLLAIRAVMADGEPHTITQLVGEINGTVISPGAAARAAEKNRSRSSGPRERMRHRDAWALIHIGSRCLIAQTLMGMHKRGELNRVGTGAYQLSSRAGYSSTHPQERW